MKVQIKEWGNSQGIRLPKEMMQEVNISVNDVLEAKVVNGAIVLTKPFRHKTLEERTAAYAGDLKLDGEFDWGEPVGREAWE